MKTSQLALAGIALLFVALRLPALSAPFTGDDLWVALSSESFAKSWKLEDLQVFMLGYDHQGTGFVDLYKWKDHPPGSFVPWAVFSLLPVPLETSMRLLVLLANLGTLAFTYLLAKKIASERTALFAAFLTAVSTYQVFHSSYLVEVTGSLVTLFTLASFYYLFKFIDSNSRKDFLPVVIASALSVFTYFLALIPLAFQCAVLALNGNRREALYLLLAPVTAMALFWAFVTYGLGSDYASGFLAYAFNPQSVTDAPTLYDSLYPKIVGAGLVATQLGTPLIALFLISAFNSLKPMLSAKRLSSLVQNPDVLVVLFVVFHFAAIMLLRASKDRFFTPALPFVFIAVSGWLDRLDVKMDWKLIAVSAASILIVYYAAGVNDYMFYSYFVYQDPAPIIAFALPLALLPLYSIARNRGQEIVLVLFGLFIGSSLYFVAFPLNNWTAAISSANAALAHDSNPVVLSKSGYMLHTAAYYDYKTHNDSLSKTYIRLGLQDLKGFDELSYCQSFRTGKYPLYYSCTQEVLGELK